MVGVEVHARVCQRHPELSDEDVLAAWNNQLLAGCRRQSVFEDYVMIGTDAKGRLIEMIAVQKADDVWCIYHAMTPPTKKILQELGFTDERRPQ